jgi:hypothetical protein
VIATLGAPLDVGAADLALETFLLPADEGSDALLRELAATRPEPQHGVLAGQIVGRVGLEPTT